MSLIPLPSNGQGTVSTSVSVPMPVSGFARMLYNDSADNTAAQQLVANAKTINTPIKRESVSIRFLVTNVRPVGAKTKYTGVCLAVGHRSEKDTTDVTDTASFELPVQVGVMMADKMADSTGPLGKFEYAWAYLDLLRIENAKQADVLDQVPEPLKEAAISAYIRQKPEFASDCVLRQVPFYIGNYDSKKDKDAAAAGSKGKTDSSAEAKKAKTHLPRLPRTELEQLAKKYLQEPGIADSIAYWLLAHARLSRSVRSVSGKQSISFNHREGERVTGTAVIDIQELTAHVGLTPRIVVTRFAPGTKTPDSIESGTEHKEIPYFLYTKHERRAEFSPAIVFNYLLQRHVYQDAILSESAYRKAAAETPDDPIVIAIRSIPKHRDYTILEQPSGLCVSYEASTIDQAPQPGTFVTTVPGEEAICFRDLLIGCQFDRSLTQDCVEDPPGRLKSCTIACAKHYVAIKPIVYSNLLTTLFGLDAKNEKDRATWNTFGPQLIRASDIIFQGVLHDKDTNQLNHRLAELPRPFPIKMRDEAMRFIASHLVTPPLSANEPPMLRCSSPQEITTAMRIARSGWNADGTTRNRVIALSVRALFLDLAQTLRECAFPVSKATAQRLIQKQVMNKKLPVGVPAANVAAAEVRLASTMSGSSGDESDISNFPDQNFTFYALSNKTKAADLKFISGLTLKHTEYAFSDEYLQLSGQNQADATEAAKALGLGDIANITSLQNAAQGEAEYMIYAVKNMTDAERQKRHEDYVYWLRAPMKSGDDEDESEKLHVTMGPTVVDKDEEIIVPPLRARPMAKRKREDKAAAVVDEEEKEAPKAKRAKPTTEDIDDDMEVDPTQPKSPEEEEAEPAGEEEEGGGDDNDEVPQTLATDSIEASDNDE